MATKSNESVNGRYFHRWNSEEGQRALAIANKALAAAGLEIHYDGMMAPGLMGDVTDEQKLIDDSHRAGIQQAQTVDQQEKQRQQDVLNAIAAAEKKAAENGK